MKPIKQIEIVFFGDNQVESMLEDLRKETGKSYEEILIVGLKHVWNKEFSRVRCCDWINIYDSNSTAAADKNKNSSKLYENRSNNPRRTS